MNGPMNTKTSTLIALALAAATLLPQTASAGDLFAVDLEFKRVEASETHVGFGLTGGAKDEAPALIAETPELPAETEVAEAESAAG